MNKTEANQVNVLLCHVLNLPSGGRQQVPDDAEAKGAAAYLADRADAALWAGLKSADVQGAWPDEVAP